ncbi:alkaline phosphatase family protein [Kiloniella sp.]|uniref:alkaline phosphatase family protein n=1 Tax=Kiloniella sp. TaxID=1938587 RepID=UPI003B014BF3
MQDMLDSFDHVVVVMLENRSFDNILGFLYPEGVPANAPLGKTFNGVTQDGVVKKGLTNPIPTNSPNIPDNIKEIAVHKTCDYHQPFPDPGETYPHVNTQLFNAPDPQNTGDKTPPYNLPNSPLPQAGMKGFVADYIENLTYNQTPKPPVTPPFNKYAQIMQCFDPAAIPVLTTLAREFAVFDQWYCSVPSQTWCNRAFWNAGTSWGHVVNGASSETKHEMENTFGWLDDSVGKTIFNQIQDSESDLTWKIYTDDIIPLTGIIHFRALDDHIFHFKNVTDDFMDDCKNGNLPSYSFVEPRFMCNHNDMHPSAFDKTLTDGKEAIGSVLLGEKFVLDIYNAIKNSNSTTGSNWENTLLIITFDEHGGCYDHVAPPTDAVSPDLKSYKKWMGFEYDRLGIRVPMIMVSANIAKNTVVNDRMDHTSFIKTMQAKWNKTAPGKFPPLTARSNASPEFHTSVFTSTEKRPPEDWPSPKIAKPIPSDQEKRDCSDLPLNDLQRSIVGGAKAIKGDTDGLISSLEKMTVDAAEDILTDIRGMMDRGELSK